MLSVGIEAETGGTESVLCDEAKVLASSVLVRTVSVGTRVGVCAPVRAGVLPPGMDGVISPGIGVKSLKELLDSTAPSSNPEDTSSLGCECMRTAV